MRILGPDQQTHDSAAASSPAAARGRISAASTHRFAHALGVELTARPDGMGDYELWYREPSGVRYGPFVGYASLEEEWLKSALAIARAMARLRTIARHYLQANADEREAIREWGPLWHHERSGHRWQSTYLSLSAHQAQVPIRLVPGWRARCARDRIAVRKWAHPFTAFDLVLAQCIADDVAAACTGVDDARRSRQRL